MSDVRIVVMQQFPILIDAKYRRTSLERFAELDRNNKSRAEAELAQAYADGYGIVDTVIGGNEAVLLTVWTLRQFPVMSEIPPELLAEKSYE